MVDARSRPGAAYAIRTSPEGRLAVWSLLEQDGFLGRQVLAPLAPDGTIGRARVLPFRTVSDFAFDDAGQGLVLAGTPSRVGLRWAPVAADGKHGPQRELSRRASLSALDVDGAGNAIIAWVEPASPAIDQDGATRLALKVMTRPAGGAFGKPATLPVSATFWGHHSDLTVAVGAGGRALVAYADSPKEARRSIRAWTGTVRRGFGGAQAIGQQIGLTRMTSTITSQGRAVVVWGSQRGGEEPGSPWIVQATSVARTEGRWSAVQTVDPGDAVASPSGALSLENGPAGTTVLAWDGIATANVAAGSANGRFSRRQVLTRRGEITGLDIRPDGAAVVGWGVGSDDDGQPTGGFAAVRPVGAERFAAGEPLAGPAPPFFLPDGAPAFGLIAAPGAGGPLGLTLSTRTAPLGQGPGALPTLLLPLRERRPTERPDESGVPG